MLIKDSYRNTILATETVPRGNMLIIKGRLGWFLMDKPSIKVFCTSNDTAQLTPALCQLLLPLSPPTRIELFVNNFSVLSQISALQVGNEALVRLEHYNAILKGVIMYKGSLPTLKGDYFGVELLVRTL